MTEPGMNIYTYTHGGDIVAVQTDIVSQMDTSPHAAADELAVALSNPLGSRDMADRLEQVPHTYMTVDMALGLLQAAAQLVVAHEVLTIREEIGG